MIQFTIFSLFKKKYLNSYYFPFLKEQRKGKLDMCMKQGIALLNDTLLIPISFTFQREHELHHFIFRRL